MPKASLRTLLAAAPIVLAACPPLQNDYLPFPDADYDRFVGEVQPIARQSCATLGCHGNPSRTLTIYSVDQLRAPPSTPGIPVDPDALSPAELQWNYDAFRLRLIDETSAQDAILLLKCLDPALGGIEHADGTVVFESRDDPDFQTLQDWIATGL